MPGRILIADSLPTNRVVLRVKLSVAFYETEQAGSTEEALRLARVFRPDVVIFSDTLEGIEPAQFTARLATLLPGAPIRSLYVQSTAREDLRHAAIAAGVEDVLVRPFEDALLLARLRSLFRAIDCDREALLRDEAGHAFGLSETPGDFAGPARIALVPAEAQSLPRDLVTSLKAARRGAVAMQRPDAILRDDEAPADLYLLFEKRDAAGQALSLLAELRAHARTRQAAIIYVAPSQRPREAAAALDLGANDVILGSCAAREFALRIDRTIARKHTADRLRAQMQNGLRAALTDPLTGLWNRRYALPRMDRMVAAARGAGQHCAVMIADIDHFKSVNDRYGHLAGDRVLEVVAARLQEQLRPTDMIARLGGEEFLIVLQDVEPGAVEGAAQRLMETVSGAPVRPRGLDLPVAISLSMGIALGRPGTDTDQRGADLLEAADRALYCAKAAGRSRLRIDFAPPCAIEAPPRISLPFENLPPDAQGVPRVPRAVSKRSA